MTEQNALAPFIRTLGRGPNLSRALTRAEAAAAMGHILQGQAAPVQIGALLMLMRYRGETAEELAGFVDAARRALAPTGVPPAVDLDWPSYADKHQQLPWFVLAALLLAANGVRIVMHGIAGQGESSVTTRAALAAFGATPCTGSNDLAAHLSAANFAYVGLETLCPPLARLFDLRPLLGLRTPANSLARALNPFAATAQIQGVFHPPYRALHLHTALLLAQPNAAIFKGGGGEAQRNPDKPCRVATISAGTAGEADWPALPDGAGFRPREEPAEVARLTGLWRGAFEAPAAIAAVTGTVAVALKLLGCAADRESAQAQAEALWHERDKRRFD